MNVKLTDIIDSVLIDATDPDSYVHGVSRELVIKHAQRAVEELRYVGDKQYKEAEGEMNAVGKFRMPNDFIDYIAIYFLHDGYKIPALYNDNINTWYSYMLKNDDVYAVQNILTNDEEMVIDNNDYEIVKGVDLNGMKSDECMLPCRHNSFLVSKNGYQFDYRDNTLVFDDVPEGYDRILICYVSNVGLTDITKINVHPYLQKYLEADIYWRIIERRRNVPMNEKIRAKAEKNRRYKDAKFEMNFKREEIIQALLRSL